METVAGNRAGHRAGKVAIPPMRALNVQEIDGFSAPLARERRGDRATGLRQEVSRRAERRLACGGYDFGRNHLRWTGAVLDGRLPRKSGQQRGLQRSNCMQKIVFGVAQVKPRVGCCVNCIVIVHRVVVMGRIQHAVTGVDEFVADTSCTEV